MNQLNFEQYNNDEEIGQQEDVNDTASDIILFKETLLPVDIFKDGGTTVFIDEIKRRVEEFVPDVTSEKGRKEIKSLRYKIARTATTLDDLGKNLGDEYRQALETINNERKKMREELEKLKDQVMKPLDEYNNRLEMFNNRIASINKIDVFEFEFNSTNVESRLQLLEDTYNDFDWQEFKTRAELAYNEAKQRLQSLHAKTIKEEADRAELIRLRQEEEARQRKEHEERIAREAAEKARLQAELEAKEALQRVEREKQDAENRRIAAEQKAKDDAIIAEQNRIEAEKKAIADKEAAVQAERDRQEAIRRAEVEAMAKREADSAHKAKINGEIASKIADTVNITYDMAMMIVAQMSVGNIPHVKINY